MKFHDFSPFYRSNEGIKPKVSGDRLLDNPLVADLQSGASFKFDGSDDKVTVTNDAKFIFGSGDYSLSFWFRTNGSIGSALQGLAEKRNGNYGTGWSFEVKDDNFTYYHEGNGQATLTVSGTATGNTDGNWHHVLLSADRDDQAKMYYDGVEIASASLSSFDAALDNTDDMLIGVSATGTEFDGEIRQVRLHNRALSAAEVRAAYSGQAVSFEYRDDGLSSYGVNVERIPSASNRTFASGIGNWSAVSITPTNDSSALKFTQTAAYSVSAPTGSITFGERGYLASSYFADFQIGRRYRLTFDAKATTAGSKLYSCIQGNGSHIAEEAHTLTTSFATYNYEFLVPTGCNPTQYFIFALDAAEAYWLDNVSCVQIGCVAEYLPSGISATKWVDTSGNGLHGSTSTATAVNHTIGSLTVESGATIKLQDGAGIDFSATSDATGKTSELLDDYEEGTWTPSLTALSTTGAVGTYIRIGSQVTAWYQLSGITYDGSGTDTVFLSGLPFSRSNISGGVTQNYSPIQTYKFNYVSGIGLYWAWDDDTKVQLYEMVDNGTSSALTEASFPTSSGPSLLGVITYTV